MQKFVIGWVNWQALSFVASMIFGIKLHHVNKYHGYMDVLTIKLTSDIFVLKVDPEL